MSLRSNESVPHLPCIIARLSIVMFRNHLNTNVELRYQQPTLAKPAQFQADRIN
jgi:hypothetical protein